MDVEEDGKEINLYCTCEYTATVWMMKKSNGLVVFEKELDLGNLFELA